MTCIYAKIIFLTILALVMMAGANGAWGQITLINEDIQSWTARSSYGTYTQAITAGTVNMVQCIVQPSASASGEGSIGRVQMQGANGILEMPQISSASTAVFHIAAGGTGRTVKLQKFIESNWIDVTTFSEIGTTGLIFSYTINQDIPIILRLSSPSAAIYVHDIIISPYPSDTPTLTTTPSTLTGLSYETGSGPSSSQFFELTGSNLDGSNVTITAPTYFQVSESETGTYVPSVTLTAYDGTTTDIWVRLKAGLAVEEYSGIVAITGGGAAVDVSVSGEVTPFMIAAYPIKTTGDISARIFSDIATSDLWLSAGTLSFGDAQAGDWVGFLPYAEGSVGWTATEYSTAKHFFFSITALSGYTIDLTQIYFEERATAGGPSAFTITVNGTDVETKDVPDSQTRQHTIDLSGFDKLTSLEFKFFGWVNGSRTTSGGGQWRVNDFQIFGTVNEVITTFTGTTDWSFSENWSDGVPDENTNAEIDGDVTITTAKEVKNLSINTGKSITISSSGNLTVHGDLDNEGTILIESNATSTGSLVHNNTGVQATIERYIPSTVNWGTTLNYTGWHLVSSPVVSQSVSGDWTPVSGYDFYAWDEATSTWLNHKVANFSSFDVGRGYLVANESTPNKSFAGVINTADQSYSLTNSGGDTHNGWNLVGNPFASAINISSISIPTSSETSSLQIWNSAGASYNPPTDNVIPAMNGFMVHTNSSISLTIPASARVHSSTGFYKQAEEERIILVARDLTQSTFQKNIVRFHPEATEGFDPRYDAYFLPGFAPQFFSMAGDNRLVMNTQPQLTEDLSIPLGFEKNSSSEFTIELSETLPNTPLFLYDRKLQTEHVLTLDIPYAFTSEVGDDPMRFELRFRSIAGTTDVTNPATETKARVFVSDNTLHVHVDRADASRMLEVYDVSGRLLMRQPLNDGLQHSMPLNFHCGIYLVRIQGQQMSQTERIFVR